VDIKIQRLNYQERVKIKQELNNITNPIFRAKKQEEQKLSIDSKEKMSI